MPTTVHRADSVVAGEVTVRASAVRSVSGGDVDIKLSAVQQVHGEEVEIEGAVVGYAGAQRMDVVEAQVLVATGRHMAARNVRALLLLAPRVHGDVRVLFDWKSALAVGAGIVLARRLLRLIRLG